MCSRQGVPCPGQNESMIIQDISCQNNGGINEEGATLFITMSHPNAEELFLGQSNPLVKHIDYLAGLFPV
jgi:hypothetical protein